MMRRLVRYLCFVVVCRLALCLFSSFAGLLVLPGIACSLQIVIRLPSPTQPRSRIPLTNLVGLAS